MFRLLAGLIIIAAIIGGLILFNAPAEGASPQPIAELGTQREQLLGATLQIRMQVRIEGEDVVGNGLGTLVRSQGEVLIVTHNHWDEVLQDTSMVEFSDARNNLLVRTMGVEFIRLVRYQDKGTLALAAPQALLAEISPSAPLKALPASQVPKNAIVHIAYRQPGQREIVTLQQAVVEQICDCSGIPGLQLRSLDGQPLQKGDSGGGVFLNGALVANNWISATAQTEEEINSAGALLEVERLVYTDISYAASLPAGALPGRLAGQAP